MVVRNPIRQFGTLLFRVAPERCAGNQSDATCVTPPAWCHPGDKGSHWLVTGVVVLEFMWTLVSTGARRGALSLEPAVLEELLEELLEEELKIA